MKALIAEWEMSNLTPGSILDHKQEKSATGRSLGTRLYILNLQCSDIRQQKIEGTDSGMQTYMKRGGGGHHQGDTHSKCILEAD